jgi:hypothetical protein
MTFTWFRKHEKIFLWGAVIFSVLTLATFSVFSDVRSALQRTGSESIVGEFVVASTGQPKQVNTDEYQRVHTDLNRWAYARRVNVTEDDIWTHLMLVADARGAGLDVADEEVAKAVTGMVGGRAMSRDDYRTLWRDQLQFPSAREFESLIRELLLIQRWQVLRGEESRIVSADDVYLRWRTDNELFDLDALVFPDAPLESVPDPDAAALQSYWDGMAEPVRNARFTQPARQDIVYAWLPLVGGAEKVPADKLASVPEPEASEVEARWNQVQSDRWPDKKELDDEVKAILAGELKLIAYVESVQTAFQALPEQNAETFTKAMTDAGLQVANPAGELGPDELKALSDLGDENLPLFLGQKQAGAVQFGYPYGKARSVYVVLVESATPSRPLTFDEAHDQLVKAWKEEQRGKAAKDFRAELTKRARELPEAKTAVEPILAEANQRADAMIAGQPELDEAGKEALRKQILDDAEKLQVAPRLAEFEGKVWSEVPVPDGVKRLTLDGVRKSYARKPDGEEAADSIERFLKSNGSVFQLAVDAVSQPLRHPASNQTAIVRVTGRSFPEKSEMLANRDSMDLSRRQLATQKQMESMQAGADVDGLKASHQLKVAEREKPVRPPTPPSRDGYDG